MVSTPSTPSAGGADYEIFRLDALQPTHDVGRLPFTLRILLENALRMAIETSSPRRRWWYTTVA
jgi:hypothetical protein